VKTGDFRDFVAVIIQQTDIENPLEIIVIVAADISARARGTKNAVPLLPDSQGVCLDSRN
jgi:hypothetical protein